MMHNLQLRTCPPLGPLTEGEVPLSLPMDWHGDPFTLLPPEYVLNAEEISLAERYRNNDISGGYIRSQIAAFRAPQRVEVHDKRRHVLSQIQDELLDTSYVLPESFVRLCSSDWMVDRLRHNNIWLDPVPLLVELPALADCAAIQVTSEGQGCCYFSLLLSKNGEHAVLYHEDEIAEVYPPPPRVSPRLSHVELLLCASSCDEWLAYYFLDCRRHDDGYAETLRRFPGM